MYLPDYFTNNNRKFMKPTLLLGTRKGRPTVTATAIGNSKIRRLRVCRCLSPMQIRAMEPGGQPSTTAIGALNCIVQPTVVPTGKKLRPRFPEGATVKTALRLLLHAIYGRSVTVGAHASRLWLGVMIPVACLCE